MLRHILFAINLLRAMPAYCAVCLSGAKKLICAETEGYMWFLETYDGDRFFLRFARFPPFQTGAPGRQRPAGGRSDALDQAAGIYGSLSSGPSGSSGASVGGSVGVTVSPLPPPEPASVQPAGQVEGSYGLNFSHSSTVG